MLKHINIISILWGIISIFCAFTIVGSNIMASIFDTVIPGFIINFICALLSIFSLIKFKTKLLSSIGIVLNIFPIAYFILLFFALG